MDVVTSLEDGGDPDGIPRYEFDARTCVEAATTALPQTDTSKKGERATSLLDGEDDILEGLGEDDLPINMEDDLVDCRATSPDQEKFDTLVLGYNLDPLNTNGVTSLQDPGMQVGDVSAKTHPSTPCEEGGYNFDTSG